MVVLGLILESDWVEGWHGYGVALVIVGVAAETANRIAIGHFKPGSLALARRLGYQMAHRGHLTGAFDRITRARRDDRKDSFARSPTSVRRELCCRRCCTACIQEALKKEQRIISRTQPPHNKQGK